MSYADFLATKRRVFGGHGTVAARPLPEALYPWQAQLVRWALRKGRAALFADCGLGKTLMQVAWADALDVSVLMLAPLCVAEQTVAEAAKFGITVFYARDQHEAEGHRLVITNYERLAKFDAASFDGVVLDESSILKSFDGKTRTALIETFANTRFRLCCTATPSPNDIAELANHAEFLGLMRRPEFLATWFVHDDTGWRMKRHAVDPFYRWLASWAVAIRSPRDIGYDDTGFTLPALHIHDEVLALDTPQGDMLFPELGVKGIAGRLAARRTSLDDRVAAVHRLLAAEPSSQWLLWCGLNEESDALATSIQGAVSVSGADDYDAKVEAVRAFVAGETRVLISKLKILGFGMNFQHAHRMAFVGMSDSYEAYYQGIRRCWRYGQKNPVHVHIIVSEAERMVVENVRRKEQAAADLSDNLLTHMAQFEREELGAA